MKTRKIIPILLAGGYGSRLWPLSRESFPKQYQIINKDTKKSLLQITQERISQLKNVSNPIIICNEEHRFIVAEQMKEINVCPLSIILEPVSRNTAPAFATAALKALETNRDPMLLFLSADHCIKDKSKFIKVINSGVEYAEKGRLVTFGVIPTHPETGYGYIESEEPFLDDLIEGFRIKKFIEKPNFEKAEYLIQDKRFSWNSGIFLSKASVIANEFKKYNKKIFSICQKALSPKLLDLDFQRLEKKAFESCEKISFDFAIMEKSDLGTVLPLNVGWSDIGTWESLWASEPKDDQGNVISGKVLSKESKNCYLKSDKKLIVSLGIKDLVVVESNDAILVAHKNYSQEIKNVVSELNDKGYLEAKTHKKVYRPWGHFISIEEGSIWQIKKIIVNPGASLSLQLHHHRAEHWIVVKGVATVEINEIQKILNENQSIYIPLGSKHRLSNLEDSPLILIEVQSGQYLGEDDIVRFEDKYGRNK